MSTSQSYDWSFASFTQPSKRFAPATWLLKLGKEEMEREWGIFGEGQNIRWVGLEQSQCAIQEMDQHARFVADLWERFVFDDGVDSPVNDGLASKRRFGSSMKVQEVNYENIPIMEDGCDRISACEQLKGCIVCCRVGKARFEWGRGRPFK